MPRTTQPESAQAPTTRDVVRFREGRLRVLVAEDDSLSRALVLSLVRSLGHHVEGAHDGAAAWTMYEDGEWDLVIADWQMPGIDGVELCRRIRAASDRTFVVMATARDGTEDLQLALEAGADDYMTKPITCAAFRARITIAERRLLMIDARKEAEADAARMRWASGVLQTNVALQHEINNPLTTLYGAIEGLDALVTDPAARIEVQRARASAERIARVVRQLARFRTHTTIEPVPGVTMLDLSADEDGDVGR